MLKSIMHGRGVRGEKASATINPNLGSSHHCVKKSFVTATDRREITVGGAKRLEIHF